MLTQTEQTLFDQLMVLTNESEAFFFADQELDTTTYRIFNYRLASYTEFMKPGALECRGIMFEMDGDKAVRLAARPMEKFFNLNENPYTMDLDYSHDQIESVMLKEDGSLISTFIHTDGEVYCKSKGSLHSDQAKWATAYVHRNKHLHEEFKKITGAGKTINLEYCAPHNRIVLNYENEEMTVLNVRHNESGLYLAKSAFYHIIDGESNWPMTTARWVFEAKDLHDYEHYTCNEQLINDYSGFKDIEGFVVRLKSGLHFKVKTEWYLVQHRAKDHVDSPRRLFEAAIMEATDDLRSLFTDNQMVLDRIEEMEEKAASIYNHTIAQVEQFADQHKSKIENDQRKEYAIAGQKAFQGSDKKLFGLVMMKFQGNEPNYKEFCVKHWKEWGIKDEAPIIE